MPTSSLIPTLRAALRLAIGAGLAIALVSWSGRAQLQFLAVVTVVMFVTDTRSLPWSVLMQQFAAGVVGILTALVLFQLADGWLMLSVVLLVVALLLEVLKLQSGRSLALLLAWAVLVMDIQRSFNVATVFNLALSFVIGLLAARLATALVWPDHPGRRIRDVDQRIRQRLVEQIEAVRQWLETGGAPPAALVSGELLPAVLELEQAPARQLGLLWRLIMRHWLLLEPQLLALPAPLSQAAAQQLLQRLERIRAALAPAASAAADPAVLPGPTQSLSWRLNLPSELIALAIAQQLDMLDQLLHSQLLLRRSGRLQRLSS